MINSRWKSTASIVLLLILLCSLCGCESDQGITEEERQTELAVEASGDARLITREKKLYPFPAEYSVKAVTQIDSVLIVGGKSSSGGVALAFADYSRMKGGGVSVERFSTLTHSGAENFEEAELYSMTGCENGVLVLTGEEAPRRLNAITYTTEESNPNFAGRYRLSLYDTSGTLQNTQTLEVLFDSGATLSGVVPYGKSLVLYGPSGWILLPETGESKFIELDDIQITTMQNCDSCLMALGYDYSKERNGPCALRIDADGGYERLDFPLMNVSACQSSDGELLLNDGTGFYTWDLGQNKIRKVMEWSGAESVRTVCRMEEAAFACLTKDDKAVTVLWSEQSDLTSENTVRVLIDKGHSSLTVKLAAMNESGSPYYYEAEIVDLSLPEERDRLLTELAAGEGPDLILFNANDLDGTALDTSSDAFEDLYPYIDSDKTLGRDAFLPGLLPALETNGELHELWTSTIIMSLAIRTRDAGGKTEFTADDLIQIFQQNGNYTYMVDSQTAETMLHYLANACLNQYIDAKNGTCRFDDPDFGALLAWCGTFTAEEQNSDHSASDCMLNMEQVNLVRLSGAEEFYYLEPYTYIGFPVGNGSGHYYSCSGNGAYRAAIPASSKNKEGAWAFIRAQLTVERQLADTKPYYSLPVIKEALDRAVQGPIGFTDAYLSEAQIEQLYVLINSIDKAETAGNEQVVKIITDAASAYFHGEKSLEETLRLIQSRASICVSEKYGW